MSNPIPFNRPFLIGRELQYITEAVQSGQLAGGGGFSRRCETWMEERFGARKVLLMPSCTAALEMAAMLCGIEPGDEVIVPSYTFVTTAGAFVLRGAKPVFVDIREDTLNIDETLVERAVTPRTRAIVPVHYAGVAAEMDALTAIARTHGLRVVEDAAQAVATTYRGRWVGTLGDVGCFSFHETKNFICGEGGAIVINDPALVERAEILREKGTDRSKFFRGEKDKYTWVDIGSSYLPSELQAAFLFAQLEQSERITARRMAIYDAYREVLQPLEDAGRLRLPRVPAHCAHNAHLFHLLLNTPAERDAMLAFLKARGIGAVFHYVPLHTSPMGRQWGYRAGDLPVTENLSARLLRLPCFYELDAESQARVCADVAAFFGR
ncbi:MAG: dTDP-4-amino-4,6-dideoxygalactose transaminase [Kiritimatiellia bacterium]